MRSTAIDRRKFLSLAAASVAVPSLAFAVDDEPLFLAARKRGSAFEVAVIDAAGRERLVLALAARGHSFAVDTASRRAVAFARQPGRFAVAFDVDGSGEQIAFAAEPDRHFFGHGLFVGSGRLLVATENDYSGARGVIGLYDATAGYRRMGEFETGGLDPHEAVLLPDGQTICVANGGVLTHPDFGKHELNIDSMAPSLAYVDIKSGDLVENVSLDKELHKLAFHHLAVDSGGTVWFGCQYHGSAYDRPPVVGRHRRGGMPELFTGPEEVLRRLSNYIGSVAVDRTGTVVATSSPVGGLVAYWDAATGKSLGTTMLRDGCGVAPAQTGRFLATSGTGEVVEIGPAGTPREITPPGGTLAWDNHLRRFEL